MGYNSRNNFIITENERKNILSLYYPANEKNDILENLVQEVTDLLNFHEKIHTYVLSTLDFENGKKYLEEIKSVYFSKSSNIINENYVNKSYLFIEDLIQDVKNTFLNTFDFLHEEENKSWFQKATDKVKSGVNFLKEKGLTWFFENLRTALTSWTGAAVQAFLLGIAGPTAGITTGIIIIVWGAMLAYDLYMGISKNEWNWINILIDVAALITSGPGAKIMGQLFKKLGLFGKKVPLDQVVKTTAKDPSGNWFMGILTRIANGFSVLISLIVKGANWLATKLNIKFLSERMSSIKSGLTNFMDKIKPFTKSAPGRAAIVGGITAGLTAATGGDVSKPLGGAFTDDGQQQSNLASDEQLGKIFAGDDIVFEV
jgi:hypothetical protein